MIPTPTPIDPTKPAKSASIVEEHNGSLKYRFKSRSQNGGLIDPKINVLGYVRKPNTRETKQRQMELLLNKLHPHLKLAIQATQDILTADMEREGSKVSPKEKLKAAEMMLKLYQSSLNDAFKMQLQNDKISMKDSERTFDSPFSTEIIE